MAVLIPAGRGAQSESALKRWLARGLQRAVLLLGAVFLPGLAAAGEAPKGGEKSPPPVAVKTAIAGTEAIDLRIDTFGTVEAAVTVTVRAQVTAVLLEACFREGQEVKKGDLLFKLDPRQFESSLRQKEAELQRQKTQAATVRREADRRRVLSQQGATTAEEADRSLAAAEALEAAVSADAAAVETARLQLDYCAIRSPVAGRTGKLLLDPGNLAKANETPLLTLHQTRPIGVVFALAERELPRVRAALAAGKPEVLARVRDDSGPAEQGRLEFLDNAVDPATGTIRCKAVFENAAERLWPGQFVSVSLRIGREENAVVIPQAAVMPGQAGNLVFVVRPDRTVEARPLVLGAAAGDRIAVREGVAAGETVVVEGQVNLVPGATVLPK